jgi:hypothetical protein
MLCSVDGCGAAVLARGWCSRHYQRWAKHGTPTPAVLTPEGRFWRSVARRGDEECWQWSGSRGPGGYGIFHHDGRSTLAHRFSFALAAALSDEMCVCHHCDNRLCVNPGHLFLGTHEDNMRDMAAKGRGRGPGLKGRRNPAFKLEPQDAAAIRSEYACGGVSQAEVGRKYGVSSQTVSLVVRGEHWTASGEAREGR